MVKKLLISLSLILSITPIHTMWSGLAQRASALTRIAPVRSLRDYALIKGLTFKKEKKEVASPVAGAVFLEGQGLKVYEGEGPLSNLARKCFHDLDGRLRITALPGNPLSSATPYYLGVLNKAIIDDDIEGFFQSETAQEWCQHHCDTKKDLKMAKFRQPLRAAVRSVSECRDEAPKVLAAAAVCLSDTRQDLDEYTRGLGVDVIATKKFTKDELKKLTAQPDQAAAHLIKRNQNDISFLHIYNREAGYDGQQEFPICAETSLWTVINFIFYNNLTGTLDASLISEGITLHPELKAFIEKYPNPQMDGYVEKAKQEWMDFISNVPGIEYCGGKNYELETDAHTALKALKYCFGIKDDLSLTQLGEKLSTQNRHITMTDDGKKVQTVEIEIFGTDDNYLIKWKLNSYHADATPILEDQKQPLTDDDMDALYAMKKTDPTISFASLVPDELSQLFIHAIMTNDKNTVVRLLECGAEIDRGDYNGYSALILSAGHGNKEIVELLLKHKAEIDRIDGYGSTALGRSLFNGHTEITNMLLQHGADFKKIKNFNNKTPLQQAVLHNMEEVVEFFLENGVDPNEFDTGELVPLHRAVKNENKKCFDLLLKYGADINKQDKDGNTALHLQYDYNADWLVENGADIEAINDKGETPLLKYATGGRSEWGSSNYLIKAGANLNAVDARGCNVLYCILEKGLITENKIASLLEHGADPNMANERYTTPFEYMYKNFFPSPLRALFLKHGACPNKIMSEFVARGDLSGLKKVLKYGVDPNLAIKAAIDGQRMVGYNLDIIDMLLDHGADPACFLNYIDYLDKAEPEFINHGSDIDKRQNIIDLLNGYPAKAPWEMIKDSYRNADGLYPGTKQLIRDAGMVPASEVWARIQQNAN
jgi:ankyrin repeat protein